MKRVLTSILAALTAITLISCIYIEENDCSTIDTMSSDIVAESTEKPTETVDMTTPTILESKPVIIEEDITFYYEYISEEDVMPYGLFTPSTANDNRKTPLIVWLHGSGERDVSEITFSNKGLPYVLNNWTLEGFDAYVICPQLKWKWNHGSWCFPQSKESLQNLIDKFVSEHNIDTDKIIISGHSLGAQGALYMAHELPDYFSKLVVLSGYGVVVDISEITIPTIGYVGMVHYGEDEYSCSYMRNYFSPTFGEENTFWMQTSHSNLPYVVFNEDKDEDGCSDVIKWMLYD